MRATSETAPERCANTAEGLTNTTDKESVAVSQSIHIPPTRAHKREVCGDRSPHDYRCNRPAGHTGRHNFSWRHLDGRVREVWA